jgi:hypothetical protein
VQYLEDLPEQCPPSSASDQPLDGVLRFVSGTDISSLSIQDFLSFAALGQKRRNANPCDLASCSLFANEYCEGFKTARKFPKLREKPVAKVSIPSGSGMSIVNKKGHIHFWMFKAFDPVGSVVEVIQSDAA